MLKEEDMTPESLLKAVKELYLSKERLISAMEKSPVSNGVENVMNIIRQYS